MREFTKSYAINRIAELIEENQRLNDELLDLEKKLNSQWLQIQSDAEYIVRLKKQLANSFIPKFEIGQRVYMIPNEFNGLDFLTEYEVLSYDLTSLGVRFYLSIIKKQKGVESVYCASEDMIGLSIFANKEDAQAKLEEIKNG